MRLIDADALYAKACDLEAQAIYYTSKISREEDEWRKWSTILTERTAFKYDVNSMPTIKPEPKTGQWIEHIFDGIMGGRPRALMCSRCNRISISAYKYCPNCGARMEGQDG